MEPTYREEIEGRVVVQEPIHQFWRLGAGSAATSCPDPNLVRGLLRTMLFGGYMQFGVRSYNPKERRERTGHVGIRPPNEHSLHFGKLGLQFMHCDLAVLPRRGDYTLGQQRNPDARGHTAQNRID